MIVDKAGRKLEAGAVVDMFISGMVTGRVMQVNDSDLVDPNTGKPMGVNGVMVSMVMMFEAQKLDHPSVPAGVKACKDLYMVVPPPPKPEVSPDVSEKVEAAVEKSRHQKGLLTFGRG